MYHVPGLSPPHRPHEDRGHRQKDPDCDVPADRCSPGVRSLSPSRPQRPAKPPTNWRVWARRTHRWGSALVALPFLLVVSTGVLLQLKKHISWLQPPTAKGQAKAPNVGFDAILEAVKSSPKASVRGWNEIERIDVQPNRGIAKVHTKSHWEVQVDLETAQLLHVAYRRSDLIESLHDGSWFHEAAKLWVFLPVGLVTMGLWFTGVYLFPLPHLIRWQRRRKNSGASTEG